MLVYLSLTYFSSPSLSPMSAGYIVLLSRRNEPGVSDRFFPKIVENMRKEGRACPSSPRCPSAAFPANVC